MASATVRSLLIFSIFAPLSAATQSCKCVPTEPCWPSDSEWAAFNTTISGRLIRTTLPASVCYPSEPDYDRAACDALIPKWQTSEFHSNDPTSIPGPSYANNSCNPIYANGTNLYGDTAAGSRGCHIGKYPPYVVNATEATHVQAAVRFATEHNLRLNVKNTGHSSMRAVAYGSLSIWTHNMKTATFHPSFTPAGCSSTPSNTTNMAATIGAGSQGRDVAAFATAHDAIIVTGTSDDVGVLGWASGGGHGFFTGTYGMGADNMLQATVVTLSTGEVLVASECQNADLFWALRGGGGGTYGVVVDVTMKAYAMPSTNTIAFVVTQRNGTSRGDWWRVVAEWHARLPGLKDSGVEGYYIVNGPRAGEVGGVTLTGTFFLHGAENGTARGAWEGSVGEVLERARAKGLVDVEVVYRHFAKWSEFYETVPSIGSAGGGGGARTSRLLTRRALTEDVDLLAEVLEYTGPRNAPEKGGVSNFGISGSMVASPVAVNSSLNPAWRDTVVHFIVSNSWDDSLPREKAQEAQDDMTNNRGNALRQLAPESGAYWNEADKDEPDWQRSLYGPNYAELSAIKKKYDPSTLLWCEKCVESELWSEREDGRLCRN
ncbi:FAD linked oxidase [Lasiodiplodia theobromae]|uniref:FAD-linked oxidoreductase ZEB1 n=1 Tax=Lasiodiplodia theobromae TaxID=45133 RepID=A0A5N5DR47_9PEZI|nr:FAD-linked oxidoreductase ZEB1 [Lasiodiplodia theobromae]KAF9632193.1 FAD linked oxidase [Lasiodiplodia theobromae]